MTLLEVLLTSLETFEGGQCGVAGPRCVWVGGRSLEVGGDHGHFIMVAAD